MSLRWQTANFDELSSRALYAALRLRQEVFAVEQRADDLHDLGPAAIARGAFHRLARHRRGDDVDVEGVEVVVGCVAGDVVGVVGGIAAVGSLVGGGVEAEGAGVVLGCTVGDVVAVVGGVLAVGAFVDGDKVVFEGAGVVIGGSVTAVGDELLCGCEVGGGELEVLTLGD